MSWFNVAASLSASLTLVASETSNSWEIGGNYREVL